jgi:choline transport protein
MIEALIQLNYPGYVPQQWHGTLLFWAVVVIAVLINTITSHILPQFEVFILVVHVLGFFAVLIPLVRVSTRKLA